VPKSRRGPAVTGPRDHPKASAAVQGKWRSYCDRPAARMRSALRVRLREQPWLSTWDVLVPHRNRQWLTVAGSLYGQRAIRDSDRNCSRSLLDSCRATTIHRANAQKPDHPNEPVVRRADSRVTADARAHSFDGVPELGVLAIARGTPTDRSFRHAGGSVSVATVGRTGVCFALRSIERPAARC
jgi:hypothetical protein